MLANGIQTRPIAVSGNGRLALGPRSIAARGSAMRPARVPGLRRGTAMVAPRALSAKQALEDVTHELEYRVAPATVGPKELYQSTAWSIHNRLLEGLDATTEHWSKTGVKHVYYLSAEFLMGRTLTNAVNNLQLEGPYGEALKELGTGLEEAASQETDAALGNGGLGRLAACFLDSLASLDLPGWGYGIRYRYGMFKQGLDSDGRQVETPDYWLGDGNPWEIRRPETRYKVGFYGSATDGTWTPDEEVIAEAYDVPIPGYATKTVGNLRLWNALPVNEFDLDAFNVGDYDGAVAAKRRADDITAVLYPNDATPYGRELRLKQQFFFVSASLQDAIARLLASGRPLSDLPKAAIFQLNDTHPTIAVAELTRLLVDVHGLDWATARPIVTASLAYTNHTVMPEALEKWPLAVLAKLLPRHAQIIERINEEWLESLRGKVLADLGGADGVAKLVAAEAEAKKAAKDEGKGEEAPAPYDPVEEELSKYSIIVAETWKPEEKLINMAFLAVVGTSAVNGVAAIHSEIIKTDLFPQFVSVFPEKFQNKTNGVTLRRWLAYANPELSALVTEALGTDAWIKDADLLAGLKPKAEDPAFRARWREVKLARKAKLADRVAEVTGIELPTSALFDVQVKRIHEYKRQFLNVINLVYRYLEIKKAKAAGDSDALAKVVPRVAIFGGKAASAYYAAKKIVALVTAVGRVVNADPDVGDLLKVVFLPNYNVSEAEVIIPAAELSEHISTGGTEASGTSNMKFALNGSLIIGTLDGANIEIAEQTGFENLFIFGVPAEDVPRLRQERKDFADFDPRWTEALAAIKAGAFGQPEYFADLVDSVSDATKGNDWFLLANDFATYADAQNDVDALYRDQEEWTRRSILYTASNGFFSSDRTIAEYAKDIWGIKPEPTP